jgi:uncharacterized protein (TIGR02145 family)
MKKHILNSMIFLSFLTVQGQNQITLTFQAKDSLTQNPLSLDSVNVRNLTEDCDTTLYDSISYLTLPANWPVGIDQKVFENSHSFNLLQNVPNPFQGTTTVRIYLKNAEELNLALFDIDGKRLAEYAEFLKQGWHLFGISTNKAQEMFLQVYDNSTSKTIKILCIEKGNEGERISYKGQPEEGLNLKLAPDFAGFVFYLGNQLEYTVYINGYQTSSFTDDPETSETYTFAMIPNPFTCGDVVSYSGQNYNTLLIGTQCWFKENLNVGDRINVSQGQTNNSVLEKYCYQDNESNCDVYGGIYQWNEAMQYVTTEGAQGICPVGWHIPKDVDYTQLSTFLGGMWPAGGKMKEAGYAHWLPPNTGASNSSGFTALPGGLRDPVSFSALQGAGYFWTSTDQGSDKWYYTVMHDVGQLFRYSDSNPVLGLSMRCLKD